jgi:hypothetical protein
MVETHDRVLEPGQEAARHVCLANVCKGKRRSEQPAGKRRPSSGGKKTKIVGMRLRSRDQPPPRFHQKKHQPAERTGWRNNLRNVRSA